MYEYKIQKEGFREDGYYTATVKVWEKVEPEKPNGDEDDQGDEETNSKLKWRIEVVYGKRVPSERFKIAEIERRVGKLDEEPFVPEQVYSQSEVTAILRAKGYIDENMEFSEDMPDAVRGVESGC